LRRSPGYTASVIAVLALGIGAVTAIFSVVYGVILQPYGFEQRGKLVVWRETVREIAATLPVLPVNYRHFRNLEMHAHSLETAALLQPGPVSVQIAGAAHPEVVQSVDVTEQFFKVLGVQPALGRTFLASEFAAGRESEAVLSWSAAQHFFGSGQAALGRTLRVQGRNFNVVGVLSPGFHFPVVSLIPGGQTSNQKAYSIFMPEVPSQGELTENLFDFNFFAIARLRPGISVSAAQAELDGIEKSTAAADHLGVHIGVAVEPFGQEITGGVSRSLLLVLAAVGGVLLIGCVNLANLQLARSVAQSGEQAVRAALGGSRSQLMWQAMSENLLLALGGVAAAVLVAYGGVHLLVALAPPGLPRLNEVRLSLPVLLVAAGLSVVTCVAVGLVPAWRAGAADPLRAMQGSGSRTAGEGRGAARTRQGLLVAEIACSVVLLAVMGMVTRSFGDLLSSARGLSALPVTMAEVELPAFESQTRPRRWVFHQLCSCAISSALPSLVKMPAGGFMRMTPSLVRSIRAVSFRWQNCSSSASVRGGSRTRLRGIGAAFTGRWAGRRVLIAKSLPPLQKP
jgi:predicted permease